MDQFETFRRFYPYTKVMVYEDMMVYSFPKKFIKASKEEAEALIKSMSLSLRVESEIDTIIIKEKEK